MKKLLQILTITVLSTLCIFHFSGDIYAEDNYILNTFIDMELDDSILEQAQNELLNNNIAEVKKFLIEYFHQQQKAEDIEAGDRKNKIEVKYPYAAFYHNGGRIIDITRPPFNAKGDGVTDDTEAINKAYNFIADELRDHGWKNNEASYILYFPEGEYLVSDTIVYEGDSIEYEGYQWGGMIRFRIIGQNRENTIIRLKDDAEGFNSNKPLLAFYRDDDDGGNIPSGNMLKNITINTGIDNPGTRGVVFYGANTSAINNVSIISEDGQGEIGLDFPSWSVQGYYRDLTIDGFDIGIRVRHYNESQPNFEYISLKNQNDYGMDIRHGGPSIRKLYSKNNVPVINISGEGSSTVIVDSKFDGRYEDEVAIQQLFTESNLFARNIQVDGYGKSLQFGSWLFGIEKEIEGYIDEYVTKDDVYSFNEIKYKSLNLPVTESPILYPETNMGRWANVDNFPGRNDAERVQNAMDSGRSTIYFPGNEYNIGVPIRVPASVKHIEFMFANTVGYENLIIDEDSDKPLFITNGSGRRDITQQSNRTIIMRNTGGRYKNPDNKKATLFIENAANLGTNDDFCPSNQKIWARSVNNEYKHDTNFKIYGGQFWTLGFKHEGWEKVFEVKDGGVLEVLGGYRNQTGQDEGNPIVYHTSDSLVSFTGFTNLFRRYEEVIWKKYNDQLKRLGTDELPSRDGGGRNHNNHIPLYTGYDLETFLSLVIDQYIYIN